MRSDCIKAASSALGRDLTASESRNIELKITEAQRMLARNNRPEFLAMTPAQRLQEAGKVASKKIKAEAAKKQQRASLAIIANQRYENYYSKQNGGMLDNIDRTLAAKLDGHDNIQSIETLSNSINTEAIRKVSGFIEELGPKWLGLEKNDAAMIPVFEHMRGKKTDIPEAKAFAEKLNEVYESLRVRYNEAGGKVGKLDDFGTPQSHSQHFVWKAGQEKWVKEITPLLDRSKYVRDDGRLMNDVELNEFLEKSWESVAYDGLLKSKGKGQGTSVKANRHSASRQLHFKDSDSYLKYHDQYSEQTLMGTILGHIQSMANDIAVIENYGPNADAQFDYWLDKGKKEAALNGEKLDDINKKARKSELLFNEVSGARSPVHNEKWARRANAFRTFLNTRLGSAVFSSMSDEATATLTAQVNNLSPAKYIIEEMKGLSSPDSMRQARRMGLGLDTMLFSIDRYSTERIAEGWSQRISGAVIRASGLSWMTDARKQAFGAVMMDGLHHLTTTHKNLSDLHAGDNQMLLSKGITESDWKIWQAVRPDEFRGNKLLTSDSILRLTDRELDGLGVTIKDKQHAVDSLLGAILEESDVAVITPGARERAMTRGDTTRGTLKGELWLSALQFKAFPIAMINRHLSRAMGIGGKSGAYYGAKIIAGTTLMGAIAVQMNEIASGRDPMEATNTKFWLKALGKGGGMGLYTDLLFSFNNQYGGSALSSFEGPSIGILEEIGAITVGNAHKSAVGQKTHSGAQAVRLVKGFIPGTSLWYAKSALDHLFFQELQEMASPGYLRRMEKRAQREFKQKYWWRPKGHNLPNRGPNLSRAFDSGNK